MLAWNLDQSPGTHPVIAAVQVPHREDQVWITVGSVRVPLAIHDVEKTFPRRLDGQTHAIADMQAVIQANAFRDKLYGACGRTFLHQEAGASIVAPYRRTEMPD